MPINTTLASVLHMSEGTWGRATIYKEKKHQDAEKHKSNEKEKQVKKESEVTMKISYQEELQTESDESSEKEENAICLPYLHSSLFGTILEDTITQLKILVETSNELKVIKTKLDWDYLLCNKYGVKKPTTLDELEGIDPKRLNCNEYKINKLDSDRTYVIDVIKRTYVDLSLHKSFKALEDSVKDILALDDYRVALAEEEARNRTLRRELARQLRQLRNYIKTVLYDSEVKMDGLISQVEDAVLNAECRSRYLTNWQRARTEQHQETIHETEVVYTYSIDYHKTRRDHEHRVHMEVEMLINIAINDNLEKIEEMMSKYDKDIEAIQLKIQIKKNDYQNMLDKRIEMEKTFEERDKMMKDWTYFKDERERQRLYHEKMTNSAIAVQAWWRGLLVRRELGPFKPAKKKKPPKKK